MKDFISAHTKKCLCKKISDSEGCNCKEGTTKFPLGGLCLTKSVVYKATVSANQPNLKQRTYHGMTEKFFKDRWYGHKHDFAHKEKYGTTLKIHLENQGDKI